jgi:cysteinyl-tRNA synthetase
LGNFFTVREILARYAPEVVRYFVLSSHYRSPLNYSDVHLDQARAALEGFYTALRDLSPELEADGGDYEARFIAVMDDDFNTAEALAILSELRHAINKQKNVGAIDKANQLAGVMVRLGRLLGLVQDDPESWLTGASGEQESDVDAAEIDAMIEARDAARAAKDWAEADRLRDALTEMGVVLEDGSGTTRWRRG